MSDDRYERIGAIEKINGYMGFAHPTVSHPNNFESAKKECIAALQRGVEAVRSLSYEQYVGHYKLLRAAAAISSQNRGVV